MPKKAEQAHDTEQVPEDEEDFSPYWKEIILIAAIVLSLLLLFGMIGIGGILGKWLRMFLFGSMGMMGYPFPFLLFLTTAFIVSNYQNKRVIRRIFCCIGIYIVLMGILQMLFYAAEDVTLLGVYGLCAKSTLGGGFLGALLSMPLSSVLGNAGAYVVLMALLLILFMFVSSRFFVSALGRKGKRQIRRMREQYQEGRQEREQERLLQREQQMLDEYGPEQYVEYIPPVRKRRRAVTFDLQAPSTEPVSPAKPVKPMEIKAVNDIIEIPEKPAALAAEDHSADPEKTKKPMDMNEYKPDIDETIPMEQQGSSEIRKELEQSFPELEFDIQNDAPYRPQIRFADSEANKGFVRKQVKEEDQDDFIDFADDSTQKRPFESTKPFEPAKSFESAEPFEPAEPFESALPIRAEEQAETLEPIQSIEWSESNKQAELTGAAEPPELFEPAEPEEVSGIVQPAVYIFPPMDLLSLPAVGTKGMSREEIQKTTEKLRQTFESFKVRVRFGNVSCGPAVTRYEIQPEQGVKVSKITNLADDIKLNLAAADIRIEAPIPGKAAIGIEVPNKETTPVFLRELLESEAFKKHKSNIAFAVGRDIAGQPMVTDIAKMPHLLIAGATGSGKSVCINTLIMSVLYKANPDDVKLIMIDPKVVELSVYNGIPHLLIPVVTDPKKASAALNWAVLEMTDRYAKFAELGVREIGGYNKKIAEAAAASGAVPEHHPKLPQIIIIVDELADLMMVAPGDVEDAICRLAQLARAAGIHLVIATQRPSVNVITGVIKANIPSRIAFSVSSAVDSRTIIDGVGAEKLLGRGDMLFFPTGFPKPVRVQGAFVSDTEVTRVVEHLRTQNLSHAYDEKVSDQIEASVGGGSVPGSSTQPDWDEYFAEAGKFIIEKDKASIGMLQRVYKIGFNRAARIMDQLSEAGVVGPEEGTKPRKILMDMETFEGYLQSH